MMDLVSGKNCQDYVKQKWKKSGRKKKRYFTNLHIACLALIVSSIGSNN